MNTALKVKKSNELMLICSLSDIGKYSPIEIGLCFEEDVLKSLYNLIDKLEEENIIKNNKYNLEYIKTGFSTLVTNCNVITVLTLMFNSEFYSFIVEDHNQDLVFIKQDRDAMKIKRVAKPNFTINKVNQTNDGYEISKDDTVELLIKLIKDEEPVGPLELSVGGGAYQLLLKIVYDLTERGFIEDRVENFRAVNLEENNILSLTFLNKQYSFKMEEEKNCYLIKSIK